MRTRARTRLAPCSSTVVCHVYYPELLDELIWSAARAPFVDRVIITCPRERHPPILERVAVSRRNFPNISLTVEAFENSGRDISPFLKMLRHPWVQDADLVLKIHSKRSPHLPAGDGDRWRKSLLDGLAPPQKARRDGLSCVLAAAKLREAPQLIWPARWAYSVESWGANRAAAVSLMHFHRYRIRGPLVFPAGSMFWCNRAFITELSAPSSPTEVLQFGTAEPLLDGAVAHAVERYLGLLALSSGKVLLTW